MPEGLLSGVLGGEEEPASGAGEIGAEAFAAAVAANLSNHNPEVAAKTAAFLQEQTKLLRAQRKTVEADYRYVEAEWGPRLLGMRLRLAFQIVAALIAGIIAIGIAVLIYDAVTSRSVVIDQFDAPPAMAEDGVNGKVLAAGLLDVLTRIQAANRSSAEHRLLSNAWTNDISIDIPETGISIGKLESLLKTRFGHDQHIDGELVKSKRGGLALTVRGTGILPKTFIDDAADLDKLLTQAGEYIYGQSQPGLWAAYLGNDRYDEAIRFSQAAYSTAVPSERPYLLNAWGLALISKGDEDAMSKALALFRDALRLKPDYWAAYSNVMYALAGIGAEEEVVRVGAQLSRTAGGRPGRAPEYFYGNYDAVIWNLTSERAAAIADMESHSGIGTSIAASGTENLIVAALDVQLHDLDEAARRLKSLPDDEKSLPNLASAAFDRALFAEETGDLKVAAREWDTYVTAYATPTIAATNPEQICFAAVTYERTGHPEKADAALNAPGKLNFVDCDRFRADVLDQRGDWSGAQTWYARAVELGPSIPSGYYSWGVALAKRGDLNGAAAKFKDSNQKGPHWAEPLKAWGDLLVKQGKGKEAVKKYDEALKFAPSWKELRVAREELMTKQ